MAGPPSPENPLLPSPATVSMVCAVAVAAPNATADARTSAMSADTRGWKGKVMAGGLRCAMFSGAV